VTYNDNLETFLKPKLINFCMKATIKNFRGSHKTQKNNHMIIIVPKVENKEQAAKLVGKEVIWTSPKGNNINGKVASAHGNSGAIRVIFEKGLPGQSLGTKVEVKE